MVSCGETQPEKNLPSEYTDDDFDFNFGCNKRSPALSSTQLTLSAPAQRYFAGAPLSPFADNRKKNSQNTIKVVRRFQLERIERCRYQPTFPSPSAACSGFPLQFFTAAFVRVCLPLASCPGPSLRSLRTAFGTK